MLAVAGAAGIAVVVHDAASRERLVDLCIDVVAVRAYDERVVPPMARWILRVKKTML